MAIWKMTAGGPSRLEFSSLDAEKRLEDMIVQDSSLLGMELLVVGRQVPTSYGGFVDVLAVDSEGHLHVLELKRDRTPREVVAQVLDYGSWVQDLTLDDVATIYGSQHSLDFGEAFAARFESAVPDVFNPAQQLTIVASHLDEASDRIVTFLADRFAVPVNVVFFRYFSDGSSEFLARTWLLAPDEADSKRKGAGSGAKLRPWNGRDFYVVLGNSESGSWRWTLGAKHGFVGAGGGPWYTKPLRNLAPGKRVFAYVGGIGYVGVGEVSGAMLPLRELVSSFEISAGTKVIDDPDLPPKILERALRENQDDTEFAVPVRWLVARDLDSAVKAPGLFASQVSVCKLRDARTIEVVLGAFNLQDE